MSKSLGNFFTVHDLLEQGYPGEVIRFVFLSTHYRKPMDWTEKKAKEAQELLHNWRLLTEFVKPSQPSKKVISALGDDLNTWEAIEELKKLASRKDAATLKASANLLGLLEDASGEWSWKKRPLSDMQQLPEWHPARLWLSDITRSLAERLREISVPLHDLPRIIAPKFDFAEGFSKRLAKHLEVQTSGLREYAQHLNEQVMPVVDGMKRLTEIFDRLQEEYPSELDALEKNTPFSLLTIENMNAVRAAETVSKIEERAKAKSEKRYEDADKIRASLERCGIILVDTPDGTKWTLSEDFDATKLEGLE